MKRFQDDTQLKNAISLLDQIDYNDQATINLPVDPSCPASTSLPSIQPEPSPSSSIALLTSTPALEKLRSSIHRRTTKSHVNTLSISKRSSTSLHDAHRPGSRKVVNRVVLPSSQSEFLNRLKTFKLTTYPPGKPRFLSPPSMACFGWTNIAKNRLQCQTCEASWVLAVPSNLDWVSMSGVQLGELGKRMRIEQHRSSCPWRTRKSPYSIYRPPRWKNCRDGVKALIQRAREISDSFFASDLNLLQSNFRVDYQLSEQYLVALSIVLQSENQHPSLQHQSPSCLTIEPLTLALFGWSTRSIVEPPAQSAQSTKLSDNCLTVLPLDMPALDSCTAPSITKVQLKQQEERKILNCELCHRQVLPFKNMKNTFNPFTEHREYCPFVDKFCGFEEERGQELETKSTGWELNLEMIQKFIHRMNRTGDLNLEKPNCYTLEKIASQFSSTRDSQANPQTLIGGSSYNRSREETHHLANLDSSPQITLLNFVKAVLAVPSPCSKVYT